MRTSSILDCLLTVCAALRRNKECYVMLRCKWFVVSHRRSRCSVLCHCLWLLSHI